MSDTSIAPSSPADPSVPAKLPPGLSPLTLGLALALAAVVPWGSVVGDNPLRSAWHGGGGVGSGVGGACVTEQLRRAAWGANASSQAQYKRWVEEGVGLAALDYEPMNTPAFLAADPPQPCSSSASRVNVFLLGDSINRFMIDDSCAALGGQAQNWAEHFAYRVDASPDKLCVTANGVIAFLNIYGSAPRGPYYGNHSSTPDDPYADTALRVQHGLDQFTRTFGEPTFVLFRSELWDLHVTAYRVVEDRAALFAKFLEDSRTIFRYIRRRLPRAYIGTHTTPTIRWGMSLFHQYQNAVRLLARESDDLFLLDFQLLLADLPLDVYLRDTHHPKPVYLSSFLDMIYRSALRWVDACAPAA